MRVRTTSSLLPFASLVSLLSLAACAKAPPARSPLLEQLAAADTVTVEQATRDCLTKGGWKVDEVGSVASSGANVVTAYKAKDQTDVYIQSRDVKPRITGGPADDDPFWKCLSASLPGAATDKGDGADKGEKPAKGDDGDKGAGDKDSAGGGGGDKGGASPGSTP